MTHIHAVIVKPLLYFSSACMRHTTWDKLAQRWL